MYLFVTLFRIYLGVCISVQLAGIYFPPPVVRVNEM